MCTRDCAPDRLAAPLESPTPVLVPRLLLGLTLVGLDSLLHELDQIGVALRLGQLRGSGGGRGPLLEQPLHDLEAPLLTGVHERRRIARVGLIEQRGRLRQQPLRELERARRARLQQAGAAHLVDLVHRLATVAQQLADRLVAAEACEQEGRVAVGVARGGRRALGDELGGQLELARLRRVVQRRVAVRVGGGGRGAGGE